MPFELCNAPATFQWCMLSIFSDLVERFLEVFMDDFPSLEIPSQNAFTISVWFSHDVEKRIWHWIGKCHFMAQQGIVLGHVISKKGIEVDKAKVHLIAHLLPPRSVKKIISFLGHAGFYRRFIQNFSKIAHPLTSLLVKDIPFVFTPECLEAFEILKKELISAPIIHAPNWSQPFELMCDASIIRSVQS